MKRNIYTATAPRPSISSSPTMNIRVPPTSSFLPPPESIAWGVPFQRPPQISPTSSPKRFQHRSRQDVQIHTPSVKFGRVRKASKPRATVLYVPWTLKESTYIRWEKVSRYFFSRLVRIRGAITSKHHIYSFLVLPECSYDYEWNMWHNIIERNMENL